MKRIFLTIFILISLGQLSGEDFKAKLIGKKWVRPIINLSTNRTAGYTYLEFFENKYIQIDIINGTKHTTVYEYVVERNIMKARIVSTDLSLNGLSYAWHKEEIVFLTENKLILKKRNIQFTYDLME